MKENISSSVKQKKIQGLTFRCQPDRVGERNGRKNIIKN